MPIWDDMQKHLDELAAADLLRSERVVEAVAGATLTIAGRRVVCLCANDYLGLSGDPAVRQAAIDAIARWGVGAGASRLVSGTSSLHTQLEQRLAEFKHSPAAIVTPTGWVANHVAVAALAGAGDLVLCDKLDHASIIDATRSCGAAMRTYPHGDMHRLAGLLQKHRAKYRRCLIVTDSLFSMDGDVADLPAIVELKHRHDAQLLIDEAHATGVLGANGCGVAELQGVAEHIDAAVGTLSKAVGAMGGFVTGPRVLIETIRNAGRAYIYTTALPPAICAAAMASLDIIRDQPDRRRKLLAMAERLRSRLQAAGWDTGPSVSQIIPVIVGAAGKAVRISQRLLEEGFFCPPIRPPTVPKGASRLRISLSALHEQADLDRLGDLLGNRERTI